jgi:hypothetical protein
LTAYLRGVFPVRYKVEASVSRFFALIQNKKLKPWGGVRWTRLLGDQAELGENCSGY